MPSLLPENKYIKFSLVGLAALVAAYGIWKVGCNYSCSRSSNNSKIPPPQVTTTKAKVAQLFVFPVKSCSGVQVNSIELLETGAKWDREWAVVSSETGRVITQREYPILRCITAFVDESAGNLILTYANRRLPAALPPNGSRLVSSISGSSVAGSGSSFSMLDDATPASNPESPNAPAADFIVDDDKPTPVSPSPTAPATPLPVAAATTTTTAAPPQQQIFVNPREPKAFTLSIRESDEAIATFKRDGSGDAKPSQILPVVLWGIAGQLFDEGDAVAEFFSSVVGVKVRLGRIFVHRKPSTSVNHKPVTADDDVVSMHDFSSLHVITDEGVKYVAELADRVPNASKVDRVDALRFRPNVVLSGVPFAEEDFWKTFVVRSSSQSKSPAAAAAAINIRVAKHCGRCSIPTILTDSTRDKAYFPTGELKKIRNAYYVHQVAMDFDGKQKWPMFGLNVFHEHPRSSDVPQIISVGDEVEVTSFATRREDQLVFGS